MSVEDDDHVHLPWEVIETLPGTSAVLLEEWRQREATATTLDRRVRAIVGCALSEYWAEPLGLSEEPWNELLDRRLAMTAEALALAGTSDDPDLRAVGLLGRLYACWGPDLVDERPLLISALDAEMDEIVEPELRLRALEWMVVDRFDHGDLDGARRAIERFRREPAARTLVLFRRRELLWEANLAMLEGAVDRSVEINQQAISGTADRAGSPFSFQNVAITVAIERYLRRGMADTVEIIESIRSSSPRVGSNWNVGLMFALAESGRLTEARAIFEAMAGGEFADIRRDLNWLVTMQLVALVAVRLEDRPRCERLVSLLEPHSHLDATHGSGYASYGPVGRVMGALLSCCGRAGDAQAAFDSVLASRAPGPWTSLTRLDQARSLRELDPPRAYQLARTASEELTRLDLPAWAKEARKTWVDLATHGHGPPIALLREGHWTLRHPEGSARVDAGVGEAHLVALLSRPGEQVDSTVLDGGPGQPMPATLSRALDDDARRAYRQRLQELESAGEAEEIERERAFLRRELAADAFAPSSPQDDRTRVRVTKAIRRAIERIGRASPALGAHLDEAITTGLRCSYSPGDGVPWIVVSELEPASPGSDAGF